MKPKLPVAGETAHGQRCARSIHLEIDQVLEQRVGRKRHRLCRTTLHPVQVMERYVNATGARIEHQAGRLQGVQQHVLRDRLAAPIQLIIAGCSVVANDAQLLEGTVDFFFRILMSVGYFNGITAEKAANVTFQRLT